ncbi:hypothetical protein N752_01875 [Desulforamulus aquiferis]|nr:hypothetical protein N752_01875 [Desulforamulus aquiferis]
MLVIGDREMENGAVALRQRGKGDVGAVKVDEFIRQVTEDIKNKTIF